VSIQAATKYIVGHSDAMLGTVTCSEPLWHVLKEAHQELGQMGGPDEIYLAMRGLRTLAVRLAVHYQNGLALARFIRARPEVEQVFHPALEDDRGHALWKRDFLGASGLFSFKLRAGIRKDAVARMLDGLKFFGMGYSWGGFESLAMPFRIGRYRSAARDDEFGWCIRLHAGLEHTQDLIADLEAGFERLSGV
jgi:cystathionine beta-lyase